jgi:hypothetical protein
MPYVITMARHLGSPNCFRSDPNTDIQHLAFLGDLEHVIGERMATRLEGSYTARLVASGMKRIAQNVSEEGLEVALAASIFRSESALHGAPAQDEPARIAAAAQVANDSPAYRRLAANAHQPAALKAVTRVRIP